MGVAAGCAPQATDAPAPENMGLAADPSALSGEFKTYVADFFDGRPSDRYHTLRQANGQELRLNFDSEPSIKNGQHIYIRGESMANQAMHVSQFDLGPALAGRTSALEGDNPDLIAAPASDTYAIVLVDLGMGVDQTAAQAQARLNGTGTGANGSFAQYYAESSYGKYTVAPTSTVFGPFPYTMAACANADTSAMATAMDAMIPTGFNHVILYFNRTNVCAFGGLGEEGSSVRPAKHTWMNGSLTCVVLMQEPGHNIGLMHANQMKCGTSAFSATPATACTITEYANSMSTMGSGCKTLSGYERMYEQWYSGCNAVNTGAGSGTFNLMPLENPCGGGIQTLQVPFPAVLPVGDPQAGANTTVNLRNYFLDLRIAAGTFDAYGRTGGQGAGVTFTAPTVFIYTSDNVRNPTQTTGRNGTVSTTQQSSVWTELLNTTPTGTAFTGLTAVGQSFADPAGGPTITLTAISATGATVQVTNAANSAVTATCLDGTTPPTSGAAMGSTTCGPVTGADGGVVTGAGGATGTGGAAGGMGGRGMGGTTGGGGMTATGMGGTPGGTGGMTGSAGSTGTAGNGGPSGTGGSTTGAGGSKGEGEGPGNGVTGGCNCSVSSGDAPAWASIFGIIAVGLLRRRRRSAVR
jgi:MYXO-CTERM domain-containing protein